MKDVANLQESKEHGTFNFPFGYYRCTIPESFINLAVHWHEEMEISLVQRGRCIYHIDLNSYEVEEGDLLVIMPHMLHGVSKMEKHEMESDSFVFSLNMLGYQYPDLCTVKYLHPLMNQSACLPIIVKAADHEAKKLTQVFLNMKSSFAEKKNGFEMEIKAGLFYFLSGLYKGSCFEGREMTSDHTETMEKIKRVLLYIQENYQNPVSIPELADISHFSEYHFMRFFKKNVEMTCIEYLNNFRLMKALEQLENTSKSVTEIALENGFNSIPYFNRLFRRRFMMTPGEFRKSAYGNMKEEMKKNIEK